MKRRKRHPNWNERSKAKLSLFTDDTMLHKENPKKSTTKIEVINSKQI